LYKVNNTLICRAAIWNGIMTTELKLVWTDITTLVVDAIVKATKQARSNLFVATICGFSVSNAGCVNSIGIFGFS